MELTASHKGWFEFRLCNKSSADELVTQDCFDKTLLNLDDGSTQFPIPSYDNGYYYPRIQLPTGLSCDYCVLQWWYRTGKDLFFQFGVWLYKKKILIKLNLNLN